MSSQHWPIIIMIIIVLIIIIIISALVTFNDCGFANIWNKTLLACLKHICTDTGTSECLLSVLDTFNKQDSSSSGQAQFSLDEVCIIFVITSGYLWVLLNSKKIL